jgi:hypothetical protein
MERLYKGGGQMTEDAFGQPSTVESGVLSSLDSPHHEPRVCNLRLEAEVQWRAQSHFYTFW